MVREKRKLPIPAVGAGAKARHDKFIRATQHEPRVWANLNAYKEPPKLKHKSYFEIAENTEKKEKKLEFEITTKRQPPPGFEFIPTGHPELTAKCKELSRDQEAMIFIVSDSKDVTNLDHHMHRFGYHFRQAIVDRARETLRAEGFYHPKKFTLPGQPESIPEDQQEMFRQADAVLRDLFPRIPNTDRYEIVRHAFDKHNSSFNGKIKVGMAAELPLARRVQLAALAHIRHTMTRYDELLKKNEWANARKAVEQACLDVIVKWRGDEETGRDQLDEILREVIEISDSEDDSDDESSGEEPIPTARVASRPEATMAPIQVPTRDEPVVQEPARPHETPAPHAREREASLIGPFTPGQHKKLTKKERRAAKRAQRRFKRYAQVAESFNRGHTPNNSSNGTNQPVAAASMERNGSRNQNSGVNRGTASNTSYLPREQLYNPVVSLPGPLGSMGNIPADRRRGQSPLLVRVGESNAPKVGQLSGHHGQLPLSPVRHQFQDMLLPSIEPQSHSVPRNREQPSYVSLAHEHNVDVPRVVSRTVVHHPLSYDARPASPRFVSGVEEFSSKRRRVATQHPQSIGEFPDTGFVRVVPMNRGNGQGMAPYGTEGRPPGNPVLASRNRETRNRSPVIFLGEPARPGRDEVAYRTGAHPIMVDTPRRVERIIEMRGPPVGIDHDGRMPLRRSEVMRDAPIREVRRILDGPRLIYMDEPEPAVMVRDYRVENRGPPPQHPAVHYDEPHHYRGQPAQPSYHTSSYDTSQRPQERGYYPVALSGNVARGSPADHSDMHYETMRDGLRLNSDFPPLSARSPYQPENPGYRPSASHHDPSTNGTPQYGYSVQQTHPSQGGYTY